MASRRPCRLKTPLVECVPNVSDGRDAGVIRACADALETVSGVALLDVHSDPDHHRSVFTYAGRPESVEQAAFELAAKTRELIDLRRHRGEHRRIGTTDVIPFIPLSGVTMDDCIGMAQRTARRIAVELDIPTFLYGKAARTDDRQWLPSIRGAGLETLAERMAGGYEPDHGPQAPHPSAGATIVGARNFLLAFNILLDTSDISVARDISARVRTTGGGLPGVQALGFRVGGLAQVSMNLFALDQTDALQVFTRVQELSGQAGVEVKSSEIVGLVPSGAMPRGPEQRLRLPGGSEKFLEKKLREKFPEFDPD